MTPDSQRVSHPSEYRKLAGRIRGLLAAMKYPETRGGLQRLAADYERLANFADARRRAAEAQKRGEVLTTFAVRQAEMEDLFEEFAKSVEDALRIRAEFIRTEIELGLTLLDSAKAGRRVGLQRSIRSAIAALQTANRFLAMPPRLNDPDHADIQQRRDQLRQRVQEILDGHQSARLATSHLWGARNYRVAPHSLPAAGMETVSLWIKDLRALQ